MHLSQTEHQVVGLVASGYQAKEIANKMFRSTHTIITHIKNAKRKNGLKNVADLTREFVLSLDNPKQFFKTMIVILFLSIQGFICLSNPDMDLRRVRRVRTSRTTKTIKA